MLAEQQPLLRTKGLTRRFGGLLAVSDLDLEIRPGEILGLIGPNGAGKSTTFNLISGFYKPSAGELFVFGENCTGRSPLAISRLGLVRTFQHGSLMRSMTVGDNILLGTIHGVRGSAQRRARVAETAEMLGRAPCLTAEVATPLVVLKRLRDEFGCPVLLVEHNMKAVMRVCDRIVVLHHG